MTPPAEPAARTEGHPGEGRRRIPLAVAARHTSTNDRVHAEQAAHPGTGPPARAATRPSPGASHRVTDHTAALAALVRDVLTTTGEDRALDVLASGAAAALSADAVALLVTQPGGLLTLRAGTGWSAGLAGRARVHAQDAGFAGHLLATGLPAVTGDASGDDRFAPAAYLAAHALRSAAGATVPGHRPAAVLAAYSSETDWFDPADADFLQAVAAVAGTILERSAARLRDPARGRDPLTGLASRARLLDRCADALERDPARTSLLVLDLDRFTRVNDWLGFDAGDTALQEVAARLRAATPRGALVARIGGDSFAILVSRLDDGDVSGLAARISAAVAAPLVVSGRSMALTAAVGIASGPVPTAGADELLANATFALHGAKERGRGSFAAFDHSVRADAAGRLALESDLHRAIANGELLLHYQPMVDVRTGKALGAEALVRWEHPVHGLLYPDAFIPAAEESGLVVPLGGWVVEEACRQLARWVLRGAALPLLHLSVNLSARQLLDGRIVAETRRALAAWRIPASALCFEVTETALLADTEACSQTLHALDALGVGIALDDFGTGYSSLGYLKRFPRIDVLKIDRSFVSGIGDDSDDDLIVGAIAGLGRGMRATVVAEGVETAEQALRLRLLGVKVAQGYLWSRPVPPEDASPWSSVPALATGP